MTVFLGSRFWIPTLGGARRRVRPGFYEASRARGGVLLRPLHFDLRPARRVPVLVGKTRALRRAVRAGVDKVLAAYLPPGRP